VHPADAAQVRESAAIEQLRDTHSDGLCALLGGEITRNRFGEHLRVRRWHAEPVMFAPHPDALRLLQPAATNVPDEATGDASNWLFLDTETTGLAGGTGTYAFLVGLAWWDAGGLQIEQLFMRDFGEEHSLLEALAARLAERPVLITFNGKTFDWPLLETRFRMTRAIEPRALAGHLDLLHPARQLWRLRLPSLRLTELEKNILGWDRGPDLWSAMIPQLYFDYLRGGPAAPLADVFRHNQMDLRGLAALAARVFHLMAAPEAANGDALELCGLSRLLRRRGEAQRARALYERALAAGLPAELDRAARRELARLAKRDRDFARANALWSELAENVILPDLSGVEGSEAKNLKDDSTRSFVRQSEWRTQNDGAEKCDTNADAALEAFEQLAIYYEHHARQPQRAAELTREALTALAAAHRNGDLSHAQHRRLRDRLQHRLTRLERKGATAKLIRSEASEE
jgi:uncharacterized protein YprB with RNaseH-like and TPR domain